MAEGVPVQTVIDVLRAHDIEVFSRSVEGNPDSLTEETVIVKDGIPEVHCFGPVVKRRMLNTLARKYDVPVHHFWNPERIAH